MRRAAGILCRIGAPLSIAALAAGRAASCEGKATFDHARDAARGADDFQDLLKRATAKKDGSLWWDCRHARALHDVATASDSAMTPAERKEMLARAFKLLDERLAGEGSTGADAADAWRWKGTVLSALSSHMGTDESIKAASTIRDAWLRALELNPRDASASHLLGRWHMKMASLSWIEVLAARALYSTPPAGTHQEALDRFLAAEEADPGFWMANRVQLAAAMAKVGRGKEGEAWARRAAAMPVLTEDDAESKKELEALAAANRWTLDAPGDGADDRA